MRQDPRQKLEREELRIIQFGREHCAVTVRRKSWNVTGICGPKF